MAFAEIARYLYEADNFEDVLTRVVETAVSAVSDCDMASITVREGAETFRTIASTHSAALAVDQAQYEAREGPCLDAVDTAVVHAPSFPDPRWPGLAGRPAESGVETIVSYRLTASGRVAEASVAGSLNAYAGTPRAFSDEAQEIGLILAAHASVGIQAARDRQAFEQLGRQLHEALSSRDVIGQAKGILMERLQITPEDAFDTLRRSSQRLNIKLREIAERLAESGEFDDPTGN
jgi:GAF domain-containing protein